MINCYHVSVELNLKLLILIQMWKIKINIIYNADSDKVKHTWVKQFSGTCTCILTCTVYVHKPLCYVQSIQYSVYDLLIVWWHWTVASHMSSQPFHSPPVSQWTVHPCSITPVNIYTYQYTASVEYTHTVYIPVCTCSAVVQTSVQYSINYSCFHHYFILVPFYHWVRYSFVYKVDQIFNIK